MRNFIFYMFGCRFIYFMIDFTLDLRLVRNGYMNLGRTTITNMDMITYPIVFTVTVFTIYYMKKGQLIRMFHLNMFIIVLLGYFRYLLYLDLVENRNTTRVYISRAFAGILTGMDFSTLFLMGFFNSIVNKSVGNTGITCLIALMNQTGVLSRTVGLSLTKYMSYGTFVNSCCIIQAILLVLLFPYALTLDKKDSKL